MTKQLISVLCLSLLATACGGGGGGGATQSVSTSSDPCGLSAQKDFVEDVATDWYYWYDELASVNPAAYSTAQAYLDALVRPITSDGSGRDPGFSYLTTISEDEARYTSGAYYGFGFRYALLNNDQDFYFSYTFEGDQLRAGSPRSAIIGCDMGSVRIWASIKAGCLQRRIFGPLTRPLPEFLGWRMVVKSETYTKAELTTPPLAGEPLLIEREGLSPVGYLHFRSFIDSADGPLRAAATQFASAGVTDLVIDLRYNCAGYYG